MSQHPVLLRHVAALTGLGLLLAACSTAGAPTDGGQDDAAGGGNGDHANLSVVTAFYPLHFLAEQVGAELVEAQDLTPSGADPHDLELSPVDVALMERADVVVYLSGFQPAVDAAVEQIAGPVSLDLAEVVDLQDTSATVRSDGDDHGHHQHDDGHSDGDHGDDDHGDHSHGPLDPHFWLDAERMSAAAEALAEALGQAAPADTDTFDAGSTQVRADLEDLDRRYQDTLAHCADEVMLVSHLAFGYLAQRYDLAQVGIAGLDPQVEPSPARLAEIRRVVEAENVSTIFVDPLASAQVSDALADELDLQVRTLDSLENLHTPDSDYLQVMSANLDALAHGLGCS